MFMFAWMQAVKLFGAFPYPGRCTKFNRGCCCGSYNKVATNKATAPKKVLTLHKPLHGLKSRVFPVGSILKYLSTQSFGSLVGSSLPVMKVSGKMMIVCDTPLSSRRDVGR